MRAPTTKPISIVLLVFTIPIISALSLQRNKPTTSVRFRRGTKSDELTIQTTMIQNLMNPLNIESKRFVVAANPNDDKDLYGWVQLRPIGESGSSTALRDPNRFDSLPGSGSVERDVIEEEIWDEFERDVDLPNGLASLPWTKEYREFSESAKRRREKWARRREEQEQKAKETMQLWELASLYVMPTWRRKGIGSELVERILAKHILSGQQSSGWDNIYLLTLGSTKNWYKKFGFEVTDEPPASMAFELLAGGVITKLIGAELVCMKGGGK